MFLAELAQFVERHRRCGMLTGDATIPTECGYIVTVVCVCGVVFQRWIDVEEAAKDLHRLNGLN